MKKEKTKVYIYTRVSTAMQIDGYSLDAQKSRMKAYAEFNDYEIVGEYEDAGKSGKSIEGRVEFNRMMEDIKSGKDGVSYILVFKLSRFGRNAADVLSTLQVMQDFGRSRSRHCPAAQLRCSQRVQEVVAQFHLEALMDRSVFKISGGEKQRVAFAAACMLGPKLLVLDEPTSNLDAGAIRQLHDMIAAMKQVGMTIVLAEHRLAWVQDVVDRYFFFEAGQLTAVWTAADFAALPETTLQNAGLRARDLTACREKLRQKTTMQCTGVPILEVQNLTLGYHRRNLIRALPDMSFAAGEIVGLMGHNGIGKSTLAKTLCGLMEPLGGQILWEGKTANARTRLHKSFLVMQDVNYQLFSDSVREEILLGAAHPKLVDTVMQALGLNGLADRHPMSLSGGQKQRVVVAAAMLSDKPLILLDEPTSGLDRGNMEQVGRLLQQLKTQGKTIVVITHDEELAADWCDRIIALQD